jgi:tRNA(adenine34) deaminase
MRRAIELAEGAALAGDVPVGAVLVAGSYVGEACNEKERRADPTAHAEMIALREASRVLGRWRLSDATIYVTKEPCVMCAGALVAARVERLVYGCDDPKGGAAGSVIDVTVHPCLNHRLLVTRGVLASETASQLRSFFETRRRRSGEDGPGSVD